MEPAGKSPRSPLDEKPAFPWISVLALVISNLFPLYFVLSGRCDVYFVLVVFWAENVFVGLFNVARMAACRNEFPAPGRSIEQELEGMTIGDKSAKGMVSRAALIPFFVAHYGLFTLVHGIFVVGVFFTMLRPEGSRDFPMSQFGLTVLALAFSHGVSFFYNYLGREEYKNVTVQEVMVRPYGRMAILHVTIVLGGLGISVGQNFLLERGIDVGIVPLMLLIVLKIAYDLKQHVKEHEKLAMPLPAGRAVEVPKKSLDRRVRRRVWKMGLRPRHTVLAAVFGVFGAALITISVQGLHDYDGVESWVETPCTILRSQEHKADPGEESNYQIWYAYAYNNQWYESHGIAFRVPSAPLSVFRKRGIEWQEGKSTTCYVNPRKPEMAYLYLQDGIEAQARNHMRSLIVTGSVSILIGACFIAYGLLRGFLPWT